MKFTSEYASAADLLGTVLTTILPALTPQRSWYVTQRRHVFSPRQRMYKSLAAIRSMWRRRPASLTPLHRAAILALVFLTYLLVLSACARTEATLHLPDGTVVQFYDDKSREGVVVQWEKTETGYSVFLSSQKSGTDPEVAKIANGVTNVLSKTIDRVPVAP